MGDPVFHWMPEQVRHDEEGVATPSVIPAKAGIQSDTESPSGRHSIILDARSSPA